MRLLQFPGWLEIESRARRRAVLYLWAVGQLGVIVAACYPSPGSFFPLIPIAAWFLLVAAVRMLRRREGGGTLELAEEERVVLSIGSRQTSIPRASIAEVWAYPVGAFFRVVLRLDDGSTVVFPTWDARRASFFVSELAPARRGRASRWTLPALVCGKTIGKLRTAMQITLFGGLAAAAFCALTLCGWAHALPIAFVLPLSLIPALRMAVDASVEVGAEGIYLKGIRFQVALPYGQITAVAPDTRGVVLTLADGRDLVLPLGFRYVSGIMRLLADKLHDPFTIRARREALTMAILEAMQRHRETRPAVSAGEERRVAALLKEFSAPDGRPEGGGPYRTMHTDRPLMLRIVGDAQASTQARLAAAAALGPARDPRELASICAATARWANPYVRQAHNQAASGTLTPAACEKALAAEAWLALPKVEIRPRVALG